MSRKTSLGISLGLFCAAATAYGSGFALYQPSAVSHAMGGALVGKAMDASANFVNPATLTDLTNIEITVGFVTEHPRGRVDVSGNGLQESRYTMDPGMLPIPPRTTNTSTLIDSLNPNLVGLSLAMFNP